MNEVLRAERVKKYFRLSRGLFRRPWMLKAVDEVTLSLKRGEIVALVGESGCGKTTFGRVVVGLMRPDSGRVLYRGKDIYADSRPKGTLQMIFQNPDSSLNPRMLVADILKEALSARGFNNEEALREVADLISLVGLDRSHLSKYPHELSGGEKQRVAIARAIAPKPDVLVADEPVSALDVSVRAQILNLLLNVQRETGVSMLFIAHDLGVVWQLSDRVAVMYLGKIVEEAPTDELFRKPLHPYTRFLLTAAALTRPSLPRTKWAAASIRGEVASPIDIPPGCRFATRCPHASSECTAREPKLEELYEGHFSACLKAKDL